MSEAKTSVLLGIDKPAGLTSHDVVARLRRALGERRIGHAGTLDPQATGVLVVGVGEATRLLGLLTLDSKCYVAEFVFGKATTTDDGEGQITKLAPVSPRLANEDFVRSYLSRLVGFYDQVPPAVSAVKKAGVRSYDAARNGRVMQLDPRRVEIRHISLLRVEASASTVLWTVALDVSKGFYVRALARDIARDLGTVAHVGALRRTGSGLIRLGDCLNLDEIETAGWNGLSRAALDPIKMAGLEPVFVGARELQSILAGQPLHARGKDALLGIVWDQKLWGVWEEANGALRCKANFPSGISRGGEACA